MSKAAKRLTFSRDTDGRYRHQTDVRTYLVDRAPEGGWQLRIYAERTVAGIRVDTLNLDKPVASSWSDVKMICTAVASEFEALGDDYRQCDHGGRARLTEAIQRAYAADRERMGV